MAQAFDAWTFWDSAASRRKRFQMKTKNLVLSAGLISGICLAALGARGGMLFTNLVAFGGAIGAQPDAGLTLGADGYFYGVTVQGGNHNLGTVYRVASDGSFTNLYSFTGGADGDAPFAPLTQAADGSFYGTTSDGGTFGQGTVFRITTNGALTTLLYFDRTNVLFANAGLVQGEDGNIYGTANAALASICCGTIFRVTPAGVHTNLFLFDGTNGSSPYCSLLPAGDGTFYGTTQTGGPDNMGTIFQVTTNGTLTTLAAFNGGNGRQPKGCLAPGTAGSLYGITQYGGSSDYGVVFRYSPGGGITNLHSFADGDDGASPFSGLVRGTDGNFYGTAVLGGRVFRITPEGQFTTLFAFVGGTNGASPVGRLAQGRDLNFYGTTQSVGPGGGGTAYRLSIPLPAVFQTAAFSNDVFAFSWSSVAGQTYQIQNNPDLASTNWTDLGGPILATNGVTWSSDLEPSDSQRFYRAVLLP